MEALPSGVKSCETKSGPTRLWFKFQAECCRAVVVKTAPSGFLVAIPKGGIAAGVFEQAEDDGYPDLIGPFTEVSVSAAGSQGRPTKRQLDVVLFDLEAAGGICLLTARPGDVDPTSIRTFGSFQQKEEWPTTAALVELAENFVQSGGNRLEAYFSAHEVSDVPGEAPGSPALPNGPPSDEGANDLLKKLLDQSEATQRMVIGMRDQVAAIGDLSQRVSKLESGKLPGAPTAKAAAAPQLFDADAQKLDQDKQDRLRRLAGKSWATFNLVAPEEDDEEGLLPTASSSNMLEQILASQTALLQKLVPAQANQADPVAFLSTAISADGDEAPRLHMLVALMAIFVEQAAYDGGSLKMAHLLTTLEDPPFAMTEMHKAARSEFPHAQLADPRWIATHLAFLKDLEGIQDKTSKYVKPPAQTGAQPDAEPKRNPKYRPKKPKKESSETQEEAA
eukprot:s910_g25.t1